MWDHVTSLELVLPPIHRKEFTGADFAQEFPLTFAEGGTDRFEFRLFVAGTTRVNYASARLRRPTVFSEIPRQPKEVPLVADIPRPYSYPMGSA